MVHSVVDHCRLLSRGRACFCTFWNRKTSYLEPIVVIHSTVLFQTLHLRTLATNIYHCTLYQFSIKTSSNLSDKVISRFEDPTNSSPCLTIQFNLYEYNNTALNGRTSYQRNSKETLFEAC